MEAKEHSKVIVHIDIDCFYAQVETLLYPEYENKPLGIQQKHIVVTCNYIARSRGVKKLMAVKDALTICPELILANGEDLAKYRNFSNKVHSLLLSFSDQVEKLGMDENFVDVTDLAVAQLASDEKLEIHGHVMDSSENGGNKDDHEEHVNESSLCSCGCHDRLVAGSLIAKAIREQLKDTLNLTCCAGIAHNKVLAKLVGSTHKPNQQTTIFPLTAPSYVRSLGPVRAIPGIGHATRSTLQSLNISTVSELQDASVLTLTSVFNYQTAIWLRNLSLGHDPSPVKPTGKPKSIGCEDGFKTVASLTALQEKFTVLLARVWKLVVEDGRMPRQVKITLRKPSKGQGSSTGPSARLAKQTALPGFVSTSQTAAFLSPSQEDELIQTIMCTVPRMLDVSKPFSINLVGLSFTNFPDSETASGSQRSITSFFSNEPSDPPAKRQKIKETKSVPKNSLLRYFTKK